ncbi:unnamed protein product [Symbiodinium natans]|uniref:Uncharacterized protein n=1 Tax=Symbiodinium natans TaxID=878477 RepID=A0A812R8U2_9DINO|nr:unnamed protein product [Symbiodinium natans]
MRSSWRLPLLGALVAGALLKFPAWVGQPSLLPLPAHTQRSQRLQGAQRPQRTQRHSWTAGPLGPVESAAAFRIYYLPFVEPLDIDGNLLDQLFGGWFGPVAPLILGVVVFWVQGQINAIRREQEGKVLSGAAKAAGAAAKGAAEGAAVSIAEKLASVPGEQWLKLVVCVVLDLAGDATFLLPGLGEFGDVAYAPVEAFALRFLFGGTGLSVLGFIEEALPFTDAVPTATTGWVLQTLFSDSPLAQLLGVQPLGSKEKDSKDPKKGAL